MSRQTDLNDPLTQHAWAKFDPLTEEWHPLYAHLEDTAEVARLLFPRWLSKSQRAVLSDAFGDEALAQRVSVWLAATHDVGKASVPFAIKATPRSNHMRDVGYVFPLVDPPSSELRRFPHGIAGQLAVSRYLRAKGEGGRAVRAVNALAEVVGGHHGSYPSKADLPTLPVLFTDLEAPCWERVRTDLMNRAGRIAQLDDDDWQRILSCRISEAVQALLTGFLIVCDWIASHQRYFPFCDGADPADRAAAAVAALNFGTHWLPVEVRGADGYFSERFGIEHPRPVQRDVVDLTAQLTEPALVLIEAPTGEGKTEMAFAAAETLAAKCGLHGSLVVLPTRATSNAMFGRVLSWLRSGQAGDQPLSVSLAHAKAQFDEQFSALPSERFHPGQGSFAHTYDEGSSHADGEAALIAHQWFRGRKRSGFADFVVGTIDQLLFMTLKAKHAVLRHLGFSGKVVIIDEIHATDDFMRTYLLRALEWLGAYGVPVIALSATLPPAHRRDLLQAYRLGAQQRGRQPSSEASFARGGEVDPGLLELANAEGYPLVTAVGAVDQRQIVSERSGRRSDYLLEQVADDRLVDAVLREAEAGGCIVVVLNTVRRAQETYAELRQRYDGEIELFHSRFTVESRNMREQELVRRLGPGSDARPQRMIVVATQVVESSLDVDFDLMFTDIAPMDLLIQRMGRVHRHPRPPGSRPETMRQPRVVLSGGSRLLGGEGGQGAPPDFDGGVTRVYGDALLLRTVAALGRARGRSGLSAITVPDDVPGLIRDTFGDDLPPLPGWADRQAAAEKRRAELIAAQQRRSSQFVLGKPGFGGIGEWNTLGYSEASEEQLGAAQVRDADLALEVVLVQEVNGRYYSLPWLPEGCGGEPVDLTSGIADELARVVATCTVSLPSWMTQGAALEGVLDDLERRGIESWQRSLWLRGMLPLVLDAEFCTLVNGRKVSYDREIGLIIGGKEDS